MDEIRVIKNKMLIVFNIKSKMSGRMHIKSEWIKHINELNSLELFGELGFELGFVEKYELNFSNISHKISNIRIEKDYLVGDIIILNTEQGKILNDNLVKYTFRPRISGKVNNGKVEIEKVVAFDAYLKNETTYLRENNLFEISKYLNLKNHPTNILYNKKDNK